MDEFRETLTRWMLLIFAIFCAAFTFFDVCAIAFVPGHQAKPAVAIYAIFFVTAALHWRLSGLAVAACVFGCVYNHYMAMLAISQLVNSESWTYNDACRLFKIKPRGSDCTAVRVLAAIMWLALAIFSGFLAAMFFSYYTHMHHLHDRQITQTAAAGRQPQGQRYKGRGHRGPESGTKSLSSNTTDESRSSTGSQINGYRIDDTYSN